MIRPSSGLRATSVYRYAYLALCCCIFIGCGSPDPDGIGLSNSKLHSSPTAVEPISQPDFLAASGKRASDSSRAYPKIRLALDRLSEFLEQSRAPNQPTPDFVSSEFIAHGVDRDTLKRAFMGDRIRIARWEPSVSTPILDDKYALQTFATDLVQPWQSASGFRIEIAVTEVIKTDANFNVLAYVEMYGQVDAESSRSVTADWRIIFDQSGLKIRKIEVTNHEEIIAYVPNGKLLVDNTASIIRQDHAINQLKYGVSQWARQIPNTDVLGNCGLAVADIDQDGRDDIYVCQGHGLPNLLFIQNPDGTTREIASTVGLDLLDHTYSALFIDIDNDGDQDFVAATDEHLVLMSNRGDMTFQLEHRLSVGRGTHSISAADYDRDGDLDLYLCKYGAVESIDEILPHPNSWDDATNGGRNVLLRNDEAWEFNDVTESAGLAGAKHRFSRNAIWADYDSDGDLDLYVVNEFCNDVLLENQGGWFSEANIGKTSASPDRHSSVSVGDFDQDGVPDFFTAAHSSLAAGRFLTDPFQSDPNAIDRIRPFLSQSQVVSRDPKTGRFAPTDLSPAIFSGMASYSSAVFDLNNDSLDDILISNGFLTQDNEPNIDGALVQAVVEAKKMKMFELDLHQISECCRQGSSLAGNRRNRMLLGTGEMKFSNLSSASGFDFPDDARAIAVTDWDDDGDQDVIVNCRTAPQLRILLNQLVSNNSYVQFQLQGTESNRDAIGTRVEVFLKDRDKPLTKTVSAGSGNLAQSAKGLHFGLRYGSEIEKVVVHWPSRKRQTFLTAFPGQRYEIIEDSSDIKELDVERTNMAFSPISLSPEPGVPSAANVSFFPHQKLPLLEFQGEKRKWYKVANIDETPLIVVFAPKSASLERKLGDWFKNSNQIAQSNVDLLTCVYDVSERADAVLAQTRELITSTGYPFRWGALSNASVEKLKLMLGDYFFCSTLPKTPFAFLLDSKGNIRRAYFDEQLSWPTISQDLVETADCIPANGFSQRPAVGNWIAPYRLPKIDRLRTRFEEIGYQKDTRRFTDFHKPRIANDFYHRAIDLASAGDLAQSIHYMKRSLDINSESIMTLVESGRVFLEHAKLARSSMRNQMLAQAADKADAAIRLAPTHVDAIKLRSLIYQQVDDLDGALDLLRRSLDFAPDRWDVHAAIGRLYYSRGILETDEESREQAFEHSIEYFRKAFDNRPNLPQVAGDLGALYLRCGQYENARHVLRFATRIQPSESEYAARLGEAEFWLGEFEPSIELLTTAIEKSPSKHARAKQILAWLLATSPVDSTRDESKSLKLIKGVSQNDSAPSPRLFEITAACHAAQGDFDSAIDFQTRAAALVNTPTNSESYTKKQLEGLRTRLEAYKDKQSYRTSDLAELPIAGSLP